MTSRSTGRCWKRGRRTRASSPRTAPRTPAARPDATSRSISGARSAPTRPMLPRRSPRPCSPESPTNTPARLCYAGHLLMENRNTLIVDIELTPADGYAERATALEMLARLPRRRRRRTVAADKGYGTAAFIADCRDLCVTPHVAQHTNGRRSAIDKRTTRHAGQRTSQRIRPRIEEPLRLDQDHRRGPSSVHRPTSEPGLVPRTEDGAQAPSSDRCASSGSWWRRRASHSSPWLHGARHPNDGRPPAWPDPQMPIPPASATAVCNPSRGPPATRHPCF